METLPVVIMGALFDAQNNPTTQEDNFGDIVDRWTLYQSGANVARLVKYFTGNFALLVGGVRFSLPSDEVQFIKKA